MASKKKTTGTRVAKAKQPTPRKKSQKGKVAGKRGMLQILSYSGTPFVQTQTLTAPVTLATGEATLWGPGRVGSTRDLPPNALIKGAILSIVQRGFLQTAATSQSLAVKILIGATEIVNATILIDNIMPNGAYWELDVLVTCRTEGAGGAVAVDGRFSYADTPCTAPPAIPASALKTKSLSLPPTTSTKPVNTTATNNVDTRVSWVNTGATAPSPNDSITSTFGALVLTP